MGNNGEVFKRCGCRDAASGRLLGTNCSALADHDHGSWYFDCAVPGLAGGRERVRRGGYPTRREAVTARDALLDPTGGGAAATWTVARWLRYWLSSRTSIRPSTLRSYTQHVEGHLIPHLGRLPLASLTSGQVNSMFRTLAALAVDRGQAPSPGTLHRIRATLRAALNAALREGLRTDNPARHVELPGPRRPHAQVWTVQQVSAWREHGHRPSVAVWTVEQLTTFLRFVSDDRLYPMWWLIALCGLRRGETAGLRWCDLDLDAGTITIAQQRLAYGTTISVGPPKTAASRRTIALDHATIQHLRQHRRDQRAERDAAGGRWQDSGYLFTTPDGQPLHPDWLTRRFHRLVILSGLPPVRLHDLRHGAASLALTAGTDLKTVQALLGHASIVLTADTYTSVLPELLAAAAEATARLVLAHAACIPGRRPRRRVPEGPPKSAAPVPNRQPEPRRPKRSDRRRSRRKGVPHTPHARPTKIKAA